jgi:hypothetical protein
MTNKPQIATTVLAAPEAISRLLELTVMVHAAIQTSGKSRSAGRTGVSFLREIDVGLRTPLKAVRCSHAPTVR